MNNNNFSMMRYFRDLGADAHLLLYAGDGRNTLSHFAPEYDTWDIDRWLPFIHKTDIENGIVSIPGTPEWLISPYQLFFHLKYALKTILGRPGRAIVPPSKAHLRNVFNGFDAYIGSGLSPAILNRVGLSLDIFYPYSIGIEFLGSLAFLAEARSGGRLTRSALRRVAYAQEDGIRRARYCLNAELSLTRQTFDKIGVRFLPLAIPAVYNRELSGHEKMRQELRWLKAELKTYDFTIISHSRLMWLNPGDYTAGEWEQVSKHNDWLIKGYAEFTRIRPQVKSLLLLLEYGTDVEPTLKLCNELGIQDRVRWLPKMARRELMELISACDVGVGEFYTDACVIWGGTGWEVLASGKPLLQSFRFREGEFEAAYGYPPPPMLSVVGSDCILKHLIDMADHPDKRETIGKEAAEWFNQYNGIGIAKKWLDLLQTP
jgi:hypothetical protein